jgi:hypothetical protein
MSQCQKKKWKIWLNSESDITPEEQEVFDNIENLVTFYEQRNEEGTTGKIPEPSQKPTEGISKETKPIIKDEGKSAEGGGEREAVGASDDFKKLIHKNIESDVVNETLSNIPRETGREFTKEEKEYNEIKLRDAFNHGADVVEKAKEEFGDDYAPKLLKYLDDNKNTLSTDEKSLIQISMEIDLESQILNNPDNKLTLEKQLKLVRDVSVAEQRSCCKGNQDMED